MKTIVEKPVTPAQIKKVHVLLHLKGLMEEKESLVKSLTSGRTCSTKELTLSEAKYMISFLSGQGDVLAESKLNVYKAIWKIAWIMGIIYGETDDDCQMNKAKLNMFCRQRGTVKKNLSEMDIYELKKTHRQFKAMYQKHLNSKKT